MSNIRTSRQLIAQRRWCTRIAVGVLVLVALIAVGAGFYYGTGSFATDYLQAPRSGWSAFAGPVDPGGTLDVGIEFGNSSSTGTIIMRSVSFPLGLPAHVHLVGQVLLLGGLGEALGWPPGRADNPPDDFPYYRLDGYKLGPKTPAIIGLGLSADTPGAFLVGPVTVHAEVPLVGTAGPGIPIQVTYSQYAALCVQVPADTCHQWYSQEISAIQAGAVQHAPGIIYSTPGTGL